jgi:hypothetical protein
MNCAWFKGKYTVEMISGGMVYIPISMTIGWSIQIILRVLLKKYERL